MSPAAFSISVCNARVSFFGGNTLLLSIALSGGSSVVNVLVGENGSGKTVTLRSLSMLLGLPIDPIRSVKMVSGYDGISIAGFNPASARTAYVYQNPEHNFDESSIADNIRAFLHKAGDFDREGMKEISAEIAGSLGIGPEELVRKPRTFSSGQLQYIAVAMRVLSRTDFALLDEPLSRLSEASRIKLAHSLGRWSNRANIVSTSLPGDEDVFIRGKLSINVQQTRHALGNISVSRPLDTADECPADPLCQMRPPLSDEDSWGRYLAVSDSGRQTPSVPMFISGDGTTLPGLAGSLSVFYGDNLLASCNVDVREGFNFIVGDNGSGKTLLSRALCGYLFRRSLFKRALSSIVGMKSLEYSGPTAHKEVRKSTYYLPPEPTLLSERTIEDEMRYMDVDSRQLVQDACERIGSSPDADITAVPYSLQKLVQFALVPETCELVVLDELFGSISDRLQPLIVAHVLSRVQRKSWKACLITANRPSATFSAICAGVGAGI